MHVSRIEDLANRGGWDGYPASEAAMNAWRAIRDEWTDERTVVVISAFPLNLDERHFALSRVVSVPTVRVREFMAEVLNSPGVKGVTIAIDED